MRGLRRLVRVAFLLVPLLAVAYIFYWRWVANRIVDDVTEQAVQLRQAGYVVAWRDAAMEGFPLSFRLVLNQPTFEQNRAPPTYALYADVLRAEAQPFDLNDWTFSTTNEAGLDVTSMPGNGRLSVRAVRVDGSLAAAPSGSRVVLRAADLTAKTFASSGAVPIARADAELFLPAPGPSVAALQATVALHDLQVRQTGLLGNLVGEISVAGRIMPPVPPGRWPDALQRWRETGGKIEFSRIRVAWGSLDVTGAGTLTVDEQSQPVGSGTATVAGLSATIDALVENGTVRPNDAAVAKLALSALGGLKGAVTLPVRVEPGALFLGPVRLMPLPRFTQP